MPRQELGRFMYAEEVDSGWEIINRRAEAVLAYAEWHKPWGAWVLSPGVGTIWSADCLAEITAFLGRLNRERKEADGDRATG